MQWHLKWSVHHMETISWHPVAMWVSYACSHGKVDSWLLHPTSKCCLEIDIVPSIKTPQIASAGKCLLSYLHHFNIFNLLPKINHDTFYSGCMVNSEVGDAPFHMVDNDVYVKNIIIDMKLNKSYQHRTSFISRSA